LIFHVPDSLLTWPCTLCERKLLLWLLIAFTVYDARADVPFRRLDVFVCNGWFTLWPRPKVSFHPMLRVEGLGCTDSSWKLNWKPKWNTVKNWKSIELQRNNKGVNYINGFPITDEIQSIRRCWTLASFDIDHVRTARTGFDREEGSTIPNLFGLPFTCKAPNSCNQMHLCHGLRYHLVLLTCYPGLTLTLHESQGKLLRWASMTRMTQ